MPPQTNFSYALWNPFIFLTSILLVKTTRKYMNWAQIEEREIKERTAKEIKGKIAKVVEEEWREEMEKKNSLGIYRKFKKEMKEEDYSGSLVNGVVESENKQPKSRRELLAEKQGCVCGM